MTYDVWICRYGKRLAFTFAEHGEAPTGSPFGIRSVSEAVYWMKKNSFPIAQVGICLPEMLGI